MLIRTIEFIYHTNKYILKRNISISTKKILLVIIETTIILIISKHISFIEYNNYYNWIENSIVIVLISSSITILINYLFYKKDFEEIFSIMKKILKRKKC